MKTDVISYYLSKRFKALGEKIAAYPSYFILIPVFITLLLCTGLQRLEENNDVEYQITPDKARTIQEKRKIITLFPIQNGTNIFPGRETEAFRGGSIIITSSDGKSVFREAVLREALLVDKLVRNVTVREDDRQWKYKDLCAKNNGKCFNNDVLTLIDKLEDIISGNYSIRYPISFSNHGQNFKFYGDSLGGVRLDKDGNVLSAQAIRLFYVLGNRKLSKKWEFAFLDSIESMQFSDIIIDGIAVISEERELDKLLPSLLPLFPFSMVAMFIFSAVTCLSKDWIRSKPWTGAIASTSAALALASGFGLMSYCGVTFIVTLAPIPFLILGVGMDDTFVLLAAWRRTDPERSTAERIGKAYEESSMAISITSLTNIIAFASGVFTSFPAVRIFSVYAATTVCFAYLYQMTFVGACMAICGYLEEQKRHSLTFLRLKDSDGKFESNTHQSSSKYFPRITFNFWQHLGDVLTKWPVKIAALVAMVTYLAVGLYGISKLNYMDDIRDSALYESQLVRFIDKQYEYFYRYDFSVQIVIDEELDYEDPSMQSQIELFLSKIENTSYIANSSLTESWLRYYLKFLKDERTEYIVKSYNMSNKEDFIKVLRNYFLLIPAAKRFQQDIAFNHNYTSIVGSRFICRTDIIKSQDDHYSAITHLRRIARESPFSVFPYHFRNFVIDEIAILGKVTLQTLSAVTVAIFFVCLLSMPDIVTVICVTCSVISTEIGVLGYMSLWDVALAPIPMIIVITCAGFAVDYAAHLSYAYHIAESQDPNQRLRIAISSVGMAIFQGFATTVISVLPLLYPIANSLVIGFKIVFMVILFSVAHALVFLPIILSSIQFLKQSCYKKPVNID